MDSEGDLIFIPACALVRRQVTGRGGYKMFYPDGTILKGSGRDIYVMEGGCRRSVACCITFDAKGYDWNDMIFVSDQDLNAIPLGEPITSDETIPKWPEADLLIQKRFECPKASDMARSSSVPLPVA